MSTSQTPIEAAPSAVEVETTAQTALQQKNRTLIRKALLSCAAAFGFCFGMIPLYSIYCEITGANGKTGRVDAAEPIGAVDRSRSVQVEFLASVNSGLSWNFRSELSQMDVHPGEIATAYFEATNATDEPIIGNAVPSVAPNAASIYFNKTECFCFTEQTLAPDKQVRMPVIFFVDPKILDDPATKDIKEITLSYTFYPVDEGKNPS